MMEARTVLERPLYESLCRLISGQAGEAGWDGWSEDNWAALARLADQEGVAGLALWALRGEGLKAELPAQVRETLTRRYYSQAAQNALLLEELGRLVKAFSEAGIPVIVLKGAALAADLYPEAALRPMNDLDLMVHLKDVRPAEQVLLACGYRTLKSSYHLVFQGGAQGGTVVEVHWSLISGTTGDYLEELWDRAQMRGMQYGDGTGSLQYLGLHPMDNLLYLSAHLIWQHPDDHARLIWYYDLHLLLERYGRELDWEEMASKAMQAGWSQPLYQALIGVVERFGTQMRAGFLEALCEGDPEARQPSKGGREFERRMVQWMWTAMGELGWRGRVRAVLGLMLPHRDYMRWRYRPRAGWLLPAYYPLRWWLLLRYGLASWMR